MKTTSRFLAAFFLFLTALAPALARAQVILDPGYITGRVTTNLAGHGVRSLSVSASGGGNSSSKSVPSDTYSLTVQAGNWDQNVNCSAVISPTGQSNPYTYVSFRQRTFPVTPGATVVNDYAVDGAFRVNLTITGDSYTSWSATSYASKSPTTGEITSTQTSTSSTYSPGMVWYMPAVPNEQVTSFTYVYVYGQVWDAARGNWYNYGRSYYVNLPAPVNLAAGQIVDVAVNVVHVAPPAPPIVTYDYGHLEGNVALDLVVDGVDYSSLFYRHYFYGTNMATNPGFFRRENFRVGSYNSRPSTTFLDQGTSFALSWPYTGGIYANDTFAIQKDQTTVKNFSQAAGILEGELTFTGIFKNANLSSYSFSANGASYYVPGTGWVYPPSSGGSSSRSWSGASVADGRYRFFLTGGPWDTPTISANMQNNSAGYYRSSSCSITDYNYKYDANTYNFGQSVTVTAGQTSVQNRQYCTGSIVLRVQARDGSLISSPNVNGSATVYKAPGKPELQFSVNGSASVSNHPAPGVELFGPVDYDEVQGVYLPTTYNLTARATAQDGSYITFATIPIDLECNVRKERDILGPDLQVTQPAAELVTSQANVTVTGSATDDTGIQFVTVNGVVQPQTGYPQVLPFSSVVTLATGANAITTRALDVEGKESTDVRVVYRETWAPTVQILSPAAGSVHSMSSTVPVQVAAADRGYGYSVRIYLDNVLVHEEPGPVDELAPAAITVSTQVGPLSRGSHTIRAVAMDRAGQSATASVTITTDLWSPTAAILQPATGSIFSGTATIPVETRGTDRGIGFTLDTFLDGERIGSQSGPANVSAPATTTFTGTVGPLAGGTHAIAAVATDTGNNSATATGTIKVDAWTPTVTIVAPAAGTVLAAPTSPFTVRAEAADQGYGFTLEVFVDGVKLGQTAGPANAAAPAAATFTGSAGPMTGGPHEIRATATDLVGNSSTATVTIYADTWPPTVTIHAPTAAGLYNQVRPVPMDVEAADRGFGYTLKIFLDGALIYQGDGPADAAAPAILRHLADIGPFPAADYILSAEVLDRSGNRATDAVTFTVPPNSPPTVDAGGPYSGNEGLPLTLSAVGSDPEGGALSYAWDLDGDGTFETTGASAAFTGADGHGTVTVTVKVTDDGGLSAAATATITIANVAPQVQAGAAAAVNEGAAFAGSGTFSDPGADSWSATVDYGDGAGPQPLALGGTGFALQHVYADNGTYTVTVTVTDDDGGAGTDTLLVTVANVAPVVQAGADAAVSEGATFAGSGSFTDPGADGWSATVDYGDGAGPQPLVPSGTSFSLSHVYSDNSTYTVTVTVTDDDGGAGTDTLQVTVANVAPVVQAGADAAVNEGAAFAGSGTFTDPGADSWTATVDYGDGAGPQALALSGTSFNLSHVYADNGTYTVTVTVADDDGGAGTDTLLVTVANVAPTADFAVTPSTIDEGGTATLVFSNPADSSPADAVAGLRYSFDCENDGTFEAAGISASTFACTYADNGLFTSRGRIQDKDGGFTDYTAAITVNNLAPIVGAISAPVAPVAKNTAIAVSASFADAGVRDTHTAQWSWGDGGVSAGTVTEAGGSGAVAGSHTYTVAGVYTVVLTVTDKDGSSGQSRFEFIVVYDPDGGFVTGGGWIDSPAGAYRPDPALAGMANFGFVSKYQQGTTVPTGNTEFNFHAGGMNFHSTDYQWLVVAGARAKFKGSGTINGGGDYGFMITATDGQAQGGGGVDKLRMKIWVKTTGQVVYDNQMGADETAEATDAIEGGNVIVHR